MLTAIVVIVGCGGDDGALPGEPIGATCETNTDCQTGVCWDFHDHDMLCAGKVCSTTCTADAQCVDAANQHGAVGASNAHCGTDGLCDLVGTGLGTFACQ